MAQQVMVCTNCGYIGYSEKKVKGSLGLEIILWLLLIIPGLIYSLWRSTSSARYEACPVCKGRTLVPATSPNGVKILQEQGKTVDDIVAEQKARKKAVQKSTLKTLKIIGIIGLVFLVLGIINALIPVK